MRNIKGVTNSFEATLNFRQAGWRARFLDGMSGHTSVPFRFSDVQNEVLH